MTRPPYDGVRVRGEFLDLSGARLYYYAAGTRGAGEPVVFLHGFPTSGHLWATSFRSCPLATASSCSTCSATGAAIVRLRARSASTRHADRVVEVLDELRIARACIVGHGLGGGIAQSIAIRHPTRVSRLCLVASVSFDTWPTLGARVARACLPLAHLLPPAVLRGVCDVGSCAATAMRTGRRARSISICARSAPPRGAACSWRICAPC